MTNIPADLKYTKEHEWLKMEGDTAIVGITDHAQAELGDIVFVELPKVGDAVTKGATFGTVESVKAVSEIFSPATGEVIEINASLADAPEKLNDDPHGAGWLVKIRLSAAGEIQGLMSAADYQAYAGAEQ